MATIIGPNRMPQEVARAVLFLESVLKEAYGTDHAYRILGNGNLLAASTMRDGHVRPNTKCARTACNNTADPELRHRDLLGLYCRPCAIRINRENKVNVFEIPKTPEPVEVIHVRDEEGDGQREHPEVHVRDRPAGEGGGPGGPAVPERG